jgi:hypothetical protein
VALALIRAGKAAGEKVETFKMGMIRSQTINAANAGAGVFYFTNGLAAESREVVDAVVAHEVAHEALGHVGTKIITSVVISTVFAVLNAQFPGVGYADQIVNPLVVHTFSRAQELEADRKAVEILGKMGYREPARTMCEALTLLRDRYGRLGGGLFATHPNIEDRIAEVAKLQPPAPSPLMTARVSPPAPAPASTIPLAPGARIVVLMLDGAYYSGTLDGVEKTSYRIRMADQTVNVSHADIAELRYYEHMPQEEKEHLRVSPLSHIRRQNGWETVGWLKQRDDDMYELRLQHDETLLFIRKSRVGSVVTEIPAEATR